MKPEICVEVHAKYIFLAYKRPPVIKNSTSVYTLTVSCNSGS